LSAHELHCLASSINHRYLVAIHQQAALEDTLNGGIILDNQYAFFFCFHEVRTPSRGNGENKDEAGSATGGRFYPDTPVMRFNDTTTDCQSQAGMTIKTVKRFKNTLALLFRHSSTPIDYLHTHAA